MMTRIFPTCRRWLVRMAAAISITWCASGLGAQGNLVLTGHDTLLHGGQSGYDDVILDYLRCSGTSSEIPKASYSLAVIGSSVGSWSFSGNVQVKPGYASTTHYSTVALNGNAALQAAALNHDCLIILSHESCGGCALTTAGSAVINSQMAGAIAVRFGQGMDIWANAGGNLATYYDFLPPGFVTTALPIAGSAFCATAAGAAIGILPAMTTGFPTHNRFTTFASSLTVLETRCNVASEIITIGGKNITLPRAWLNKDLRNFTNVTANGVELLVQGSFSSVISHFDGGFPTFTITPAGANTRFTWSGMVVAPSVVKHVGVEVYASTLTVLGVSWLFNGSLIACAPQCNALYGTHSSGNVIYRNNVTSCSAQPLHAGNLSVEYYVTPPALAELNPLGTRSPIEVFPPPGLPLLPAVAIPVQGQVEVPVPLPPPNAVFVLLVFDVGASPNIAGPGTTGDFMMFPLDTAAAASPRLVIDAPIGPGSLGISNVGFSPGDVYFTALTLDPANAGPGLNLGWWFGLWIPLNDLFLEFSIGQPPFLGTLDASGASTYVLPPVLPPGITLYGQTTTYSPANGYLTASPEVATFTSL